jgi:hypothetical protein
VNDLYITPCNPMKCDHYVYGELCGKESECMPYINYQALKIKMREDKKKQAELEQYHLPVYKNQLTE